MHQIKENVCFLSTLYILRKGTSYLDFFFQGLVTMNTYSRGHVFFVQPCGFIRFWAPLYRSESPTQVSLCIIKYCALLVKMCGIVILSQMFLFYDNMCNIQRLKLWTSSEFNQESKLGVAVFNKANKGVDALHIANHVRDNCKQQYPLVINSYREKFSQGNTQSAEQTFCWLGKFKKILNSMNKRHHHFYLHCLVKERNRYTEFCHKNNLVPKLPQAKSERIAVAPLD